jgi:hypothetical protein
VDWPEGMAVDVSRGDQRNEFYFDGSQCNDTAEGIQKWLDWFDSLEPVLTGEELDKFEANLRSARDAQKALLPKWEAKLDNLAQ